MALHVYANDCDWVVAESIDDAWSIYGEMMGSTPEQARRDYEDDDPLELLPDDKVIALWMGPDGKVSCPADGGAEARLPAGEWAKRCGRGFLASTEY
jgi:hypothetical protein